MCPDKRNALDVTRKTARIPFSNPRLVLLSSWKLSSSLAPWESKYYTLFSLETMNEKSVLGNHMPVPTIKLLKILSTFPGNVSLYLITFCYGRETVCWRLGCCWLRWGSMNTCDPNKSHLGGSEVLYKGKNSLLN